jgi:hypothetical protein
LLAVFDGYLNIRLLKQALSGSRALDDVAYRSSDRSCSGAFATRRVQTLDAVVRDTELDDPEEDHQQQRSDDGELHRRCSSLFSQSTHAFPPAFPGSGVQTHGTPSSARPP